MVVVVVVVVVTGEPAIACRRQRRIIAPGLAWPGTAQRGIVSAS